MLAVPDIAPVPEENHTGLSPAMPGEYPKTTSEIRKPKYNCFIINPTHKG